jgi:pyruvate-formate lyase-activating enzyme
MYDVIFFADTPSAEWLSRGYGAYRLASDLRQMGFSVLTVDFTSSLNFENYKKIIDLSVGPNTLMVGFSTSWFPYRTLKNLNPRYSVGNKSIQISPDKDFLPDEHPWYFESLSHNFALEDHTPWIDYVKDKNPNTKITVGGCKSHEYVNEEKIDNIFLGFSENMLRDYIWSISGKGPKHDFKKVINYDIKATMRRFDFVNTPTTYVDTDCWLPGEFATFEFARGCIFNCTFCSYPHKGQQTKDFIKKAETIKAELEDNYYNHGIKHYMVVDDTFNDHVEKLRTIRDVIKELDFQPKFWAYCRMDLFKSHPEMITLMKEIGITEVYYGMEAWNDKTAKVIRKGGSKENKIESIKKAKEVWGDDVYITVGLVVGLPHDNEQDFLDAAEWFINEGRDYIDWFNLQSLGLNPPLDSNSYSFMSEIEKNPQKYGYSHPDLENAPLEWLRNDDGDINSKKKADEVMVNFTQKTMPYNKKRKQMWWQSPFQLIDARYEFEYLRNTDEEEWDELFTNFKHNDLYYEWVSRFYWPKFFETLEKKHNSQQ